MCPRTCARVAAVSHDIAKYVIKVPTAYDGAEFRRRPDLGPKGEPEPAAARGGFRFWHYDSLANQQDHDQRSLALHRLVVERMRADPALMEPRDIDRGALALHGQARIRALTTKLGRTP